MSKHWPLVPLGNILTERQEAPSDGALTSGEIPIIAKIGFNDGRIQLRHDGQTKTGMILIRPGDFVISGINAAKGAIAVYDEENTRPIAGTIHYGAYIPKKECVDVSFLWWLLRSRTFRNLLLEYVPGGVKTELKSKRLFPIPIPLPPLPEQHRIVAQIESLAAKIQEGSRLRQETTDEAETLVCAQLRTMSESLEQRHGTRRIETIIAEAGYGSSEKCSRDRNKGAVPVLRIPNVVSEQIDLKDLKFAHLPKLDHKGLLLASGDILVVRTNGSRDLVGRSAVVDKLPEPMAFASYMIRLRLNPKEILPTFAQRMLQHLRVSGQLIDFARTTAGQYNVSLGRLRSAEIPVPPLPDQLTIVEEIDGLQAKVDALKKLQSETAAELDALLPSILDKAFKGEL